MARRADAMFLTARGRLALAAAVLAVLAPGCHTWHSFKDRCNTIRTALLDSGYDDPKVMDKLAQGDQHFAAGDYKKAQEVYRDLADNRNNPTDLAEQARFMQAECRFARGQFPEAVDTYHKLLMDFPTGAHRRESCARMYEIADFWLNDFRDELEKRKDEQGVLGWRPAWKNPFDTKRPLLGQEGRTLEALDRVWTHDMMGPLADKALFWCGYVNYVRGNFQEADHFFSTLVEVHKESDLRAQAMAYAIQAKNAATGGADYDGRKCAEALQLVNVAEATVPELTQDAAMAAKLTRAKFAIRSQQAEKDIRMAEYYERTGHPGPAVFYYELVRRRYAGTRYSDVAGERKEWLLAQMKSGKPLPGIDPIAQAKVKWQELFGNPARVETATRGGAEKGGSVQPAGGVPGSGVGVSAWGDTTGAPGGGSGGNAPPK